MLEIHHEDRTGQLNNLMLGTTAEAKGNEISSPEPKAQSELIGCSVVRRRCRRRCRSHFSNIFSSETPGPINAKLHVEHP